MSQLYSQYSGNNGLKPLSKKVMANKVVSVFTATVDQGILYIQLVIHTFQFFRCFLSLYFSPLPLLRMAR